MSFNRRKTDLIPASKSQIWHHPAANGTLKVIQSNGMGFGIPNLFRKSETFSERNPGEGSTISLETRRPHDFLIRDRGLIRKSSNGPSYKCPGCKASLTTSEMEDHYLFCPNKICLKCRKYVPKAVFDYHDRTCGPLIGFSEPVSKSKKSSHGQCPYCFEIQPMEFLVQHKVRCPSGPISQGSAFGFPSGGLTHTRCPYCDEICPSDEVQSHMKWDCRAKGKNHNGKFRMELPDVNEGASFLETLFKHRNFMRSNRDRIQDFDITELYREVNRSSNEGGVQSKGVTSTKLLSFPTKTYKRPKTQSAEEDLCAICLVEYKDGDCLRVLPCKHFFHKPCIDIWLARNTVCPLCKKDFKS